MREREEKEEGYQGKTKRKVKLERGRQVEKETGKEGRERKREKGGECSEGEGEKWKIGYRYCRE